MKSKKIVAMFVALLTFMAVATSGLAAVKTTTNYILSDEKVNVIVNVDNATSSSEVTYLVKNSDGDIVYIDQAKANDDGEVVFNYKIAKDKLPGLKTSVSMGTNGANKISTGGRTIKLGAVELTVDDNATVAFYPNGDCVVGEELNVDNLIVGTENTIFAVVTPKTGYEIAKVTGKTVDVTPAGATIELELGDIVDVTTQLTSTEATVYEFGVVTSDASLKDAEGNEITAETEEGIYSDTVDEKYTAVTKILKVAGTYSEVGVKYADDSAKFPALNLEGNVATSFIDETLYAVRVVFEGEDVKNLVPYSVR